MPPLLVLGLFGFLGKVVKGAVGIVGGVAKVAGGLGLIPGGGLIGRLAGGILAAKQPMGSSASKTAASQRLGVVGMRGHTGGYGGPVARTPLAILRRSPVMPGGAVATRTGVAARPLSGNPPTAWAGSATAGPKKKRRKRKSARSTSYTRRKKKRTGARGTRKRGWRRYKGRWYSPKQAKHFLKR